MYFLLIRTLPTFWAEWIWILRMLHCWYVLDPTFLDFQVRRSPNSQISRFPDFQTPPAAAAPDELSDPNLTPLPTHPGVKYVARSPCCDKELYKEYSHIKMTLSLRAGWSTLEMNKDTVHAD